MSYKYLEAPVIIPSFGYHQLLVITSLLVIIGHLAFPRVSDYPSALLIWQ
jgi:hypothetical protein